MRKSAKRAEPHEYGRGTGVPDPIDVYVGGRIRTRRLYRDMRQEELARKLGLTFQQVQKYESGTNRVGVGRLVRIAQALDVPVMALLAGIPGVPGANGARADGADVPQDAAAALALIAGREPFRLAQSFSGIAATGLRRAVVRLVEDIARINRAEPRENP